MNTGFKGLDKIINIEEPQLILLTGSPHFVEELSGDIANNVCLKQECEVLEIVRCRKEYLIQRMFVNEANVNYINWYLKNRYSDEELKRIGQSIVNLIEGTKRLPKIIEQDMWLYDLKNVARLVENYANSYADKAKVDTLIIIDVFPLLSDTIKNMIHSTKRKFRKYIDCIKDRNKIFNLIKNLQKISHKLKCPIIFVDNIDFTEWYNKENHTWNYLTKKHIDNIKKMNKYVDTFIIANAEKDHIFNVDVYNQKEKIGNCKLKWNFESRKFLDYEKGKNNNGCI